MHETKMTLDLASKALHAAMEEVDRAGGGDELTTQTGSSRLFQRGSRCLGPIPREEEGPSVWEGQTYFPVERERQESRCAACGVEIYQEHLNRCSLGRGLYIPAWMRGPVSSDPMGVMREVKRIDMLPESRRKHRRIRKLLLQLKPESIEPQYYRYFRDR
jgi:hypothetical protein